MDRYESEGWTPEQFIDKMEDEGGIADLLMWGGPGCFPPEIRDAAIAMEQQLVVFYRWLNEHGY